MNNHPLIKGIEVTPPYPTYIPPQHFALALIDLAVQVNVGPSGAVTVSPRQSIRNTVEPLSDTEASLVSSLIGQDTSIRTIQAAIEKWFTESMERVSGTYKRKTYTILLFVSILISLLFGLDSIRLARELYKNQPVREALIKAGQSSGGSSFSLSELPIGWTGLCGTFFPGCLLSAFALTLGAPFWFDLLSRLANLRQTGIPPDMKPKLIAQ